MTAMPPPYLAWSGRKEVEWEQAADRLLVEKTADTNSPAPSSLNAATWEVSSNLETTGNASICFQLPKKYRKLLKNFVAMPIFSVFCGSLLPSWIRIRIRNTGASNIIKNYLAHDIFIFIIFLDLAS
jgi:hypothetical protein